MKVINDDWKEEGADVWTYVLWYIVLEGEETKRYVQQIDISFCIEMELTKCLFFSFFSEHLDLPEESVNKLQNAVLET